MAGAYAACVADIYQAQRAELSNHANIITIGAQVIGLELAKCFIKEYLSLQYDPDGRSAPKVEAIIAYEKSILADRNAVYAELRGHESSEYL